MKYRKVLRLSLPMVVMVTALALAGIGEPRAAAAELDDFLCYKAKSTTSVKAKKINIQANIDGRSHLIIKGNSVQWQHFDWKAPGRETPVDLPTIINGEEWFPVWDDVPNRTNEWCDGCVSSILTPDPPLPWLVNFAGIDDVSCRQSCEVFEEPSAANGFKLVIEFNDNDEGSSEWYEVNVLMETLVANLTDQFEVNNAFDVKGPASLCNPADKQGGGINDANTHLKGYKITPETAHVPRTNIKIENQFGTIFVDTTKPDRLLVPTAKDLNNPVDPPDNAAHNVDHYKCYKVKVTKGTPKFVPILGVAVDDQFTDGVKAFNLKKPTRLCTPVKKEVNGEVTEIKNPAVHLMCYQAQPAKGQPKHIPVLGIHVNNQFGPDQLDTVKEEELCVPSTKTLP